ncbi:MAG TPA: plastocyanin/azurin family copper-binding protein [Anaerolineae bacterium]
MRFLSVLLLLAGLASLSGCAAGPAGQATAAVSTNQVDLPPSYRFDPPTIQVAVGTTVTWTNHDNFTHNVHLLGDRNWVSQPLRPGERTSYTFAQAGTYPYQCDFHAHDMKGTVIVTAR